MQKISGLIIAILLCIAWPVSAETYTVQRGDTLGKIAKGKGISVAELARINGIENVNKIKTGQKLEIVSKAKTQSKKRQQTFVPSSTGYAHIYSREMGKPFAPRINGVQKKLTAKEYDRHMKNIMRHGVSREGARSILASKENGLSQEEIFLPNGTIVKAVSFGKDEVWTGGVLINVKAGGINAILYRGWTGEFILDALNCGNYISPREVRVPTEEPGVTAPLVIEVSEQKKEIQATIPAPAPCKSCKDALEFDAGAYTYWHRSGGSGNGAAGSRGYGVFGEAIYWKNFAEDCASEYYWGVGFLASAYWYGMIDDSSSSGNGDRLVVQGGIKRVWTGDDGLSRQWVAKLRFGIERSHWEDSDHSWSINQIGPVIGEYLEYRQELIYDKLWWFATIESWFGLGGQSVSSSFSDTKADSKIFAEAVVGVDYRIAKDWKVRAYGGLDYEGWSDLIPGVLGVELCYDIPNDWGTIRLGPQAKIYAAINPTVLFRVTWDVTRPVEKWYGDKCQKEVQLVGTGIGGNQFRAAQVASATTPALSRDEAVFASLSSQSQR